MKLKNIFKKTTSKKATKVTAEVVDKKQLEKVVGGTDEVESQRWQQQGIGHTIVVKSVNP